MYNHAPKDYICPFCLIVNGIENEHLYTKQADIVYKDDYVTAFIGAGWWKNNKGHVIIIPNNHFENIYDLPIEFSTKIHELEKKIAIALKTVYKCDGVSSRQHNEPCGNQDVWHYHLHVYPRYKDDNLYLTDRELSKPQERKPIIDIAVGVESLEYGEQLIPVLCNIGYIYDGDGYIPGRHFFKKKDGKLSTHYIHVEPINGNCGIIIFYFGII